MRLLGLHLESPNPEGVDGGDSGGSGESALARVRAGGSLRESTEG